MAWHKAFIVMALGVVVGIFGLGCQKRIPKDALRLSPESLKNRQLQTRVFETNDEHKLLTAANALIQDLGYTMDEIEVPVGVIVASRERDVKSGAKVAGSCLVGLLCCGLDLSVERNQKVLASCVTRPLDDKRIAVRVTFQHMIWNTENELVKNEQINDPEIYQEFFSKFSKSVFLTGHEI